MRLSVVILLAFLAIVGSTLAAPSSHRSLVRCGSIITPGAPVVWKPERVVLGVAAVPPAFIPQTTRTEGRWPYWSKAGLVIRANSPAVIIDVPPRWKSRAAITWGDGGPASALRTESCPTSGSLGDWNAYAGGFYLRSRAACVPLTFSVAGKSATVRFGVGKRCS